MFQIKKCVYCSLQRKTKRGRSKSEEDHTETGDADAKNGETEEVTPGTRADGGVKEGSGGNGDSHSNNDEEWDSKSGERNEKIKIDTVIGFIYKIYRIYC